MSNNPKTKNCGHSYWS